MPPMGCAPTRTSTWKNGIVIDCVIECPLHQGRFDVRTGKALSAPVCVDLKTWPVKREGDDIYINIATH